MCCGLLSTDSWAVCNSCVCSMKITLLGFVCIAGSYAYAVPPANTASTVNFNMRQSGLKLEKLTRLQDRAQSFDPTRKVLPPPALTIAHSITAAACIDCLEVSVEKGLSNNEAFKRLHTYGTNTLPQPRAKSLLALILEQLDDRLVQLLMFVAVLSAGLAAFEKDVHSLAEPVIIMTILTLNACVGIWQGKSAASSLDALKKLQPETSAVVRDGITISDFPTSMLVPGDIIFLRVGDRVPADARIIKLVSNTFSTDEGSLTGESVTVSKTVDPVEEGATITGKTNMVFSGTVVTNGQCYAVVTSTGPGTEIGQINAGVQAAKEENTKTPLALQLDKFGNQLTVLIGWICAAVWVVSIPKFSNPTFSSWTKGAIYYAKVAVALGVAAIPEGLPAVITLCLSLGTRRMAQRNVIVRKLSSVETLGCTSVVCTDKTGTLTTNKMTVKALITASDLFKVASPLSKTLRSGDHGAGNEITLQERAVEGSTYSPSGHIANFTPQEMQSETFQLLASIATMCNDAEIVYKNGEFERVGEPTEAALKVLVEKLGVAEVERLTESVDLASQYGKHWASQYSCLSKLEFNRDRKSMSALVRPTKAMVHKNNFLFVKGACEMVVARCNRIQLEDGAIVNLSPAMREQIMAKFYELAQRPLRCLALAYKTGDQLGALNTVSTFEDASKLALLKDSSQYANIETDLILVGITGIMDPARPEAAEAIRKCTQAGIRVMMITGDSKETAVAIAKDVHIFEENVDVSKNAFTGREFFALDPDTQLNLLKTGNKVFCRAEPRDKQRLISMLEKLDEVVAMTGDGVNDAPALQQAAIGIAMGITGTEVAKGAADMILADDNFSTIVSAVEEGRNIYANMQSFICFLISSNIGEVLSIFLATMLGLPEPLTPLHLLWVNLVTDGPPATALGFNPSDPAVMLRQPRAHGESILSPWLLTRYAVTGLYVGFATIGSFVWWYLDKGVTLHQLRNWGQCLTWKNFAHSAEAPRWPKYPCKIFEGNLKARPQSMALTVLVLIEMLKALSAVSLDSSLLKVQPWQNPWLLAGVALPIALHLLVMYFPPLSYVFGLSPLSVEEWKVALMFALPVLLVEEVLKFVGRRIDNGNQIKQKQAKVLDPPVRTTPPMF